MEFKIVVYLLCMCAVNAFVTLKIFDEDKVGEVTSNSLFDCNHRDCNAMCRDSHFTGGWCVNGKCSCNNAFSTDSERGCNLPACKQWCRRLGFPGGGCVGNKCDCHNFLSTTEKSVSKVLQDGCEENCQIMCQYLRNSKHGTCDALRTCTCYNDNDNGFNWLKDETPYLQGCSSSTCSQLCKRMGYPGGECDGDLCKCNMWMETGSKVSLEIRTCNVVRCSDMCHRMLNVGGMCGSEACICY